MCNCNRCAGHCPDNKVCVDDADCSMDGETITPGSCKIDPKQGCYGQAAGGSDGGCGDLTWEGKCVDKSVQYCSNSGAPQSVSCAGSSCCGWSAADSSYACLDAKQCGGCIAECDKAGERGCSKESTHAWECVNVKGCLTRNWIHCKNGGNCDVGQGAKCVGGTTGGGVKPGDLKCPPKKGGGEPGADAGSGGGEPGADAGSGGGEPDASGSADVGSGGGGGPNIDAGSSGGGQGQDGLVGSDGGVNKPALKSTQAAKPEGLCSASGSSSNHAPWSVFGLVLLAFSMLTWRRRQTSG